MLEAVRNDYRTAPIGAPLQSALRMLEVLALRPWELGGGEIDAMRQTGLDTLAIEDAIGVGSVFAMFVRVADALGFTAPTPREGKAMARMLGFGYDKHHAVAPDFPRHAAAFEAVARAVATAEAATDLGLRAQLTAWVEHDVEGREPSADDLPEPLRPLVVKEARHAYKIVDEDLALATDAGFEAAAIYDVIVTVATAAGTARYKQGLAALRDSA